MRVISKKKFGKQLGFLGDSVFGEKEWKWGNGDKWRCCGGAVEVRWRRGGGVR
jgi:hypothetical protein